MGARVLWSNLKWVKRVAGERQVREGCVSGLGWGQLGRDLGDGGPVLGRVFQAGGTAGTAALRLYRL